MLDHAVTWLTPGHAARWLAGILEPYAELASSGEQLGICEAAELDYDDAPTGTVDRTMRRCHGP